MTVNVSARASDADRRLDGDGLNGDEGRHTGSRAAKVILERSGRPETLLRPDLR